MAARHVKMRNSFSTINKLHPIYIYMYHTTQETSGGVETGSPRATAGVKAPSELRLAQSARQPS